MLAELICMEFETVSDLKSDKDKSTALADTHMADRVFYHRSFRNLQRMLNLTRLVHAREAPHSLAIVIAKALSFAKQQHIQSFI